MGLLERELDGDLLKYVIESRRDLRRRFNRLLNRPRPLNKGLFRGETTKSLSQFNLEDGRLDLSSESSIRLHYSRWDSVLHKLEEICAYSER